MTLEELREELTKRGCTKYQLESKVLAVALDVMTQNENNVFTGVYEAEQKIKKLEREQHRLEWETEKYIQKIKKEKEEVEKGISRIESFNNALLDCADEETRNTLKTIQFFKNSIDLSSNSANVAFIVCLAEMLSNKHLNIPDTLDKIEKINFDREQTKNIDEIMNDYWLDEPAIVSIDIDDE